MRVGRGVPVAVAVVLATTFAAVAVTAGGPGRRPEIRRPDAALAAPATSPAPPSLVPEAAPPRSEAPRLVAWHGPVGQIFVHPLVLRPQLAFTDDPLGQGFADYFVTAREFRALLDELWRHGWTLVDIHRAAAGKVRVPAGRRPLVLIEDDVNYYRYFRGRGLAAKLVLSDSGRVRALTPAGRVTDLDVVPLVEQEVARHPEFSADGAKGVLAVTGYEGLLGEHRPGRPAARDRLRALADRLRATGWTFASHTYGHLDLSTSSAAAIGEDTRRWQALAGPLLGPVDVLVYPFGARPSQAVARQLRDAGFGIQEDIDIVARRVVRDGVVVMSRRHVDGLAFAAPERQAPFFDVAVVRDPARPG